MSDEEYELAVIPSERDGAEPIRDAEVAPLDSRRKRVQGFAEQAGAPVAQALVEGFECREHLQEMAQAYGAQAYG